MHNFKFNEIKCFFKGEHWLGYPLNLERNKDGSDISVHPVSHLPKAPRTQGSPPPPLDPDSGAWLQGNAAANPFSFFRDRMGKVIPPLK